MDYCEPTYYDIYNNELLALCASLTNFQQISQESKFNIKIDLDNIIKCDIYSKENSLLYACETEEFVDFIEGKPALFFKYNFIILLGSSKSESDPFGILPQTTDIDKKYDLNSCNLYLDYFSKMPNNMQLTDANELSHFIHKQINFCRVPRGSVLYIEKKINYINFDNVESLIKVQKFLENDKKKLDSLQARIDDADLRMRIIFETIQTEKKFNIEKIKKILSFRGGSIDEYLKTIDDINNKILLISLSNNI